MSRCYLDTNFLYTHLRSPRATAAPDAVERWRTRVLNELELAPTDQVVVERARSLMANPGLPPRDVFHGAHALVAGCGAIASSDAAFDDLEGLRRISP